MNTFTLSIVIAGSAIMGGIIGGGINQMQTDAAESAAWSSVMVIEGGTLVANPSALTPRQLADARIIDPRAHLTICTDTAGETFVNPKPDECEQFKSIRHYN